MDQLLSQHFDVTGVDISPIQIERAKRLVPTGKFLCRDMASCDFEENSFAGILSLYAIIHVPLENQRALLEKMRRWLKPGGHLLITVGHKAWTGCEDDWLGVEGATMYWSHADRDTYVKWLSALGFDIVHEEFVPEGDGGHALFLVQKPARS
jgi:SAM-dependent methyltransferase